MNSEDSQSATRSDYTPMKPAEFIECREALGLSRQEMASKLRMAAWGHQTIGDWEEGKREIPGTVSLGVEYLMFLHACDFPLPEGTKQARQDRSKTRSSPKRSFNGASISLPD